MISYVIHLTLQIVHTPDQDYTDFTKALMELYKYCQESNKEVSLYIFVFMSRFFWYYYFRNISTSAN